MTGDKTVRACDSVTVLNLVEGARGRVTSPDGRFPAQEVHYAETFVIPAGAGDFTLSSPDGKAVMFVAASVRG